MSYLSGCGPCISVVESTKKPWEAGGGGGGGGGWGGFGWGGFGLCGVLGRNPFGVNLSKPLGGG